jgi:hypothetical protein
MKIAPRSCWNRWGLRLHGRAVVLVRRILAAVLFVAAVVLATRPTSAGPAPPGSPPAPASVNTAIALGPGQATVPVRLADPGVAELLRQGMRVDVVTAEAGEPSRQVLASMATVVDVRSPPSADGHLLPAQSKGPLVLLSAPVDVATRVAALSLSNLVAITFR